MIHVKSKDNPNPQDPSTESAPRLIGVSPLNRPLNDPNKPTHILPADASFRQVQQCTRPPNTTPQRPANRGVQPHPGWHKNQPQHSATPTKRPLLDTPPTQPYSPPYLPGHTPPRTTYRPSLAPARTPTHPLPTPTTQAHLRPTPRSSHEPPLSPSQEHRCRCPSLAVLDAIIEE